MAVESFKGFPISSLLYRRELRNRGVAIGGLMLCFIVLVALTAAWLAPYDPMAIAPGQRLRSPSPQHLWGTDQLGRDIFSRVLFGARLSLLVAAGVGGIATVAGTALGLCAGYFRQLDGLLMRLTDGLMAFPSVLLAVAIMAAVGPRLTNVILALSLVYTPRIGRVVRATVLVLREMAYVEAGRALGSRDLEIIGRHLLPNCLAPLLVQVMYTCGLAVLVEASLSFLGVGAPPEIPSWGNILADSNLYVRRNPWMPLLPGVAIMWTVLSLNLLGDGLRDVLDPQMRGR